MRSNDTIFRFSSTRVPILMVFFGRVRPLASRQIIAKEPIVCETPDAEVPAVITRDKIMGSDMNRSCGFL
jgi:hypothetical protein